MASSSLHLLNIRASSYFQFSKRFYLPFYYPAQTDNVFAIALYYDLPVYWDTYRLIFMINESTGHIDAKYKRNTLKTRDSPSLPTLDMQSQGRGHLICEEASQSRRFTLHIVTDILAYTIRESPIK